MIRLAGSVGFVLVLAIGLAVSNADTFDGADGQGDVNLGGGGGFTPLTGP